MDAQLRDSHLLGIALTGSLALRVQERGQPRADVPPVDRRVPPAVPPAAGRRRAEARPGRVPAREVDPAPVRGGLLRHRGRHHPIRGPGGPRGARARAAVRGDLRGRRDRRHGHLPLRRRAPGARRAQARQHDADGSRLLRPLGGHVALAAVRQGHLQDLVHQEEHPVQRAAGRGRGAAGAGGCSRAARGRAGEPAQLERRAAERGPAPDLGRPGGERRRRRRRTPARGARRAAGRAAAAARARQARRRAAVGRAPVRDLAAERHRRATPRSRT